MPTRWPSSPRCEVPRRQTIRIGRPRGVRRPRVEAEIETARRLLDDVEGRAAEEQTRARAARSRRAGLEASRAEAESRLASAAAAEGSAASAREVARGRAAAAEADRAGAHERAAMAATTLASVRARADTLAARLAEEEARGIARAARRVGGRRLDEDLAIDPAYRAAVEAALAETTRAYVVTSEAVAGLAAERGSLVVAERTAQVVADDAAERRFRAALAAAGGGTLDASVRHDPTGAARRLLAHAAWLPDLAGCVTIQGDLPAGWIAVPRDGSAVVTDITVTLGTTEIRPRAAGRVGETGRRGCATRDRAGDARGRSPGSRRGGRCRPGRRRGGSGRRKPCELCPPGRGGGRAAGCSASSRRSSVRLPGMRRRPNGWQRSSNVPGPRSRPSVLERMPTPCSTAVSARLARARPK